MKRAAPPDNITRVDDIDPEAKKILETVDNDEAFWVADFNRIRHSLKLWEDNLPNVNLFYAMKCCDEPELLKFLAKRGYGFDCASSVELQTILNLGVDPKKIIFTHPLKPIRSLQFAREKKIKRLVYDTEEELRKIMNYYPEAEVFLRIKPTFSNARIRLSNKFGATPDEARYLMDLTKELDANFIGFAFHVGSYCDDKTSFDGALKYSAELRKYATKIGLNVSFIDIGGGFLPPTSKSHYSFEEIAESIKTAIDQYFPDKKVTFNAEPGRFIGSEYMDLYMPVICNKEVTKDDGTIAQCIFIPDGIYGCFNAIMYDHAEPHFYWWPRTKPENDMKINTMLWGQTCDSMDEVYDIMQWPRIEIGDILFVRKFSAYTYSPHSNFNGFLHHRVFYINEDDKDAKS